MLTTIDVATTLKQKLGTNMEDYLILSARNPALANRALDADRCLAQLPPCDLVVRADPESRDDTVLVEAADPQLLIQFTATPEKRSRRSQMKPRPSCKRRSARSAETAASRGEPR